MPDLTAALQAWENGDAAGLGEWRPLVLDQLRRIAGRCVSGERAGHSLQASALVNEAFLRLAGIPPADWERRVQFLAKAARLMRHVLVEAARARRSDPRGGGATRVTLDETLFRDVGHADAVVTLDEALQALAAIDERKSAVAELRFFGGLTVQETAAALRVSERVVTRDWEFAKRWLP